MSKQNVHQGRQKLTGTEKVVADEKVVGKIIKNPVTPPSSSNNPPLALIKDSMSSGNKSTPSEDNLEEEKQKGEKAKGKADAAAVEKRKSVEELRSVRSMERLIPLSEMIPTTEGVKEKFWCTPAEATFAPGYTEQQIFKLKLHNSFKYRVAFKVRCSDNEIYRLRPVFDIIPAEGTGVLTIGRLPNKPDKDDKLVILYKEFTGQRGEPPIGVALGGTAPSGSGGGTSPGTGGGSDSSGEMTNQAIAAMKGTTTHNCQHITVHMSVKRYQTNWLGDDDDDE